MARSTPARPQVWRLVAVAGVVLGATAATGCGRSDGDPGNAAGPREAVSASAIIGPEGGAVTSGTATLTIPPGALERPVEITITPIAEAPWGVVGPAYDIGPDGLEFRTPATLALVYDPEALPPGVAEDLLRVSLHERNRWAPVEGGRCRPGERVAVAELHHMSVYGLAPLGDERSAFGRSLAVNGVTVETSVDAFIRLRVSPTMVNVSLARGDDLPVDVTLSGLPSDAAHHLFLGSYQDSRVIRPEDGAGG